VVKYTKLLILRNSETEDMQILQHSMT